MLPSSFCLLHGNKKSRKHPYISKAHVPCAQRIHERTVTKCRYHKHQYHAHQDIKNPTPFWIRRISFRKRYYLGSTKYPEENHKNHKGWQQEIFCKLQHQGNRTLIISCQQYQMLIDEQSGFHPPRHSLE